jgi:HD-like signal output (HDOD) protein
MPRVRDVGEPPQGLDDDQAILEGVLRDLHFEVQDADYPGVRRVVEVLENALTKRRFNLAPFPAIAARLVGRNGPPPSDDQLIDIVKSDPALAGKIVAIANSTYYLGAVPVNSVPRAVTRLGMLEVRRRCLAAAMDAAFDSSGFGEVMEGMQTHALATGMFSEMLSPWARQDPGEAFLAGLLHDAGEVAIYRLVSVGIKDSQKRGENWRPDSALLWHLAEHYHPRVGVIFFRGWDLAPAVLSAMAYHHHPHWSAPEHRRLTMLVHIANKLAERAIAHTQGPQWQACMEVRNPDASEEALELAALGDGVDTIYIEDLAGLMPVGFDGARLPGLIRSVLLRMDLSDAVDI